MCSSSSLPPSPSCAVFRFRLHRINKYNFIFYLQTDIAFDFV